VVEEEELKVLESGNGRKCKKDVDKL